MFLLVCYLSRLSSRLIGAYSGIPFQNALLEKILLQTYLQILLLKLQLQLPQQHSKISLNFQSILEMIQKLRDEDPQLLQQELAYFEDVFTEPLRLLLVWVLRFWVCSSASAAFGVLLGVLGGVFIGNFSALASGVFAGVLFYRHIILDIFFTFRR